MFITKKNILTHIMVGSSILFFVLAQLSCMQQGDSVMNERVLTKKEIIRIGGKALQDKYDLDINKCRITYDNGNKIWKKYYEQYYPNLTGHDYQAVKFDILGTLKIGGGPYWVCVDRITGEVLVTYMGI
jgi:hypothetical protein